MNANESFKDLVFPVAGMDLSRFYGVQMAIPMPNGEYGKTTRLGRNVRGFEPGTDRVRGGSRPGIERLISVPVVADWVIQDLSLLVGTGYLPPGGTMQLSQSGRIVTLVAVSKGDVYVANAGDDAWGIATNNTGGVTPLAFDGIVYSTALNQKTWFADGQKWTYYDPSDNTCKRWDASQGALPADEEGNPPRLICSWRGRVILSGVIGEPQNIFMSAVGDPTDFDYAPEFFTTSQAVALNASPLGLIGDMVTCLIPYTDDVLLIGGDSTIWMLRGDPAAGGNLDLVSNNIGMAWGKPYTMDPYGTVYFFSNKCGVYKLVPGNKPERFSQPIDQILHAYNPSQMTIRLLWNDRRQGLHVFLTFTSAPALTTHFFWEQRSGAWWMDRFSNTDHNPLCCCVFDGNLPDDRAAIMGSWNGYVYSLSGDAEDDDGTPIESTVVLGPIVTKNLDELLFKNIQCVLGETSGDVEYSVHVGATAEVALSRTAVASGTWEAGRNLSNQVRRSGHALYVKMDGDEPWAMESIRASIAGTGKVRMRGA